MKLYTADRETGTFIEEIESINKGLELIEQYEEEDRKNGDYTPNFYDIVNEEHLSQI